MIILDTDSLSLLERKSGAEFFRLSAKLAEFPPDEIATTIINFEEQMRGREKIIQIKFLVVN